MRKSEDGIVLYIDPGKGMTPQAFTTISQYGLKRPSSFAAAEACDQWRYSYSSDDSTQLRAKVPSQELSDAIVSGLKE